MDRLPEHLFAYVLALLPAETVQNLRSVSKWWQTVIDNPEFIRLHLRHGGSSMSHTKLMFHVKSRPFRAKRCKIFSAAALESPDTMKDNIRELNYPCKRTEYSVIHGSCDGLICLGYGVSDIVLWNPCTYQRLKLPSSVLPCYSETLWPRYFYGFGDDGRGDYKVVRLVQLYDKSRKPMKQEVKVYSLKSNVWRNLAEFQYSVADYFICGVMFVSGAVHWFMVDNTTGYYVIVALNLGTEVRYLVPHPAEVDRKERLNLGVLNGCLCFNMNGNNVGAQMDLWIMKEYCVKESWTKLCVQLSSPNVHEVDFLAWEPLLEYGNVVFSYDGGGDFLWFDTGEDIERKVTVRYDLKRTNEIYYLCVGRPFICSLVKLPYSDATMRSRKRKGDNTNYFKYL